MTEFFLAVIIIVLYILAIAAFWKRFDKKLETESLMPQNIWPADDRIP